jgi:hypothetical protein
VDQHNQCERSGSCITLPVWEGLARVVTEYLDGITLQAVLDAKLGGGCHCDAKLGGRCHFDARLGVSCHDGGCDTPPVVDDEDSAAT